MSQDLFQKVAASKGENTPAKPQTAEAPAQPSRSSVEPLSTRMRPRSLDEFAGQTHILGPGKLLRRAIQADRISSILLWGPPGTGKTSLAQIIALATSSRFEQLNGVESNVADIRRVISTASNRLANTGHKTILFVDEIHRFNKAQQDVLLPDVERGTVRLIGATTHNPLFYVNAPLVSRSQIFELKSLSLEDIETLLRRALADSERGLGKYTAQMEADALRHLAVASDGDARKALNSLEIGVVTTQPGPDGVIHVTREVAEESIQKKSVVYDAGEDEHYDTISAFIKSMRGSDPDAALYWLAKMLVAGEDIRFLARRLVICAAEDVGMAAPQALILATAAQQGVEFVGMPEAQLLLAEATLYIATAPKSNASAKGIWTAMSEIQEGRTMQVPDHLKDTHYKGAERLGHGEGYQYAHDFEDGIVAQDYLPEKRTYYEPTDRGYEKEVRRRLEEWREKLGNRK